MTLKFKKKKKKKIILTLSTSPDYVWKAFICFQFNTITQKLFDVFQTCVLWNKQSSHMQET